MIPQISGIMGSYAGRAGANFAWPTAQIAVTGSQGAVGIFYRKELEHAVDVEVRRAELIEGDARGTPRA